MSAVLAQLYQVCSGKVGRNENLKLLNIFGLLLSKEQLSALDLPYSFPFILRICHC